MKTQIAICLSTILAFGLSGRVLAQLTAVPMIDTPTQRWLPPPKPFPNQPDSQAKLLSRLRDFVLSKDQSRESNPSRLSNADIQSLKEAMKQFGGNLPDGLTSNSLDAIPPDLISKALSNPELMRQAKELAEQFRKIGRPRSTDGSAKSNESPEQESSRGERNSAESQSKPNVENGLSPVDPGQRPKIPAGDPKSQSKPYKEEFAKLMEKLRSTQQQFEKNQDDATEPLPSTDPTSPVRAPAAPNKDAQKNVSKSGTKPSGLTPPESDPTPTQPPASRGIKRPMPSQKGSLPSTDNPSNQRTPQPERNSKSPNPSWSDSDPFDSKQFNPSMQTELDQSSFLSNAIKDLAIEESQPTAQSPRSSSVDNSSSNVSGGNKSASGSGDSKSTSSMDIRKEMQRRGFGPTLQKIVEEAQRASKSSPASPQPSAKTPTDNSNKLASPDTAIRPPNSVRPNRSVVDTNPKPPKPDSDITKILQQTGKYLNNLWTQIAKTEPGLTPPTAPSSSPPQTSSVDETFALPNPFNAHAMECLIVLCVAGLVAFLVLRYRVRSEQERREILEAQMAPRIEEIRTREDVVRAFHALARQRLKSAQAWWTCGFVRERFLQTLPEHASSIRTLSGLYEQARYFPVRHQLTDVQIEDAKLALKQCKG